MALDLDIDAAWLTRALRASGALAAGEVAGFEAELFDSNHANNARLRLDYTAGARGDCPPSLFLKRCQSKLFDRSEVDFYVRDYAALAGPPVVRCHFAEYRDEPRGYRLLLDDLSATHQDRGKTAPTPAYASAFGEALARLHAHRWGAARIADAGYALPERARLDRFVQVCSAGVPRLLEEVPAADAAVLEAAWSALPAAFAERAGHPEHLTLVHGDLNPTNVLAAREGSDPGPLYFVDRQPFRWSLRVWTPASDLAYAIGLAWPAEGGELEGRALAAYSAALAALGIDDYGPRQLSADYRLGLAQWISVPANWCVLDEPRERMRWLWTRQAARLAARLRARAP